RRARRRDRSAGVAPAGCPRLRCHARRRPREPRRRGRAARASLAFRAMRLVLDWDGTVTERDLDAGRMTLNDVIAEQFGTVTAPLDEVIAYVLEHARVRPGFAALART